MSRYLDPFIEGSRGLPPNIAYPGFVPELMNGPVLADGVSYYDHTDDAHRWSLDFHVPQGMSPLGFTFLVDGFSWGTQSAAKELCLPASDGLSVRLYGTHVYKRDLAISDPAEILQRRRVNAVAMETHLREFPERWKMVRERLERGIDHFSGTDLKAETIPRLMSELRRARDVQRDAWEEHFFLRYLLLQHFSELQEVVTEAGGSPDAAARMLQGRTHAMLDCDLAVATLSAALSPADLSEVRRLLATTGRVVPKDLSSDAISSVWLARFRSFMKSYQWSMPSGSDPNLEPWAEDARPVLLRIVAARENPISLADRLAARALEADEARQSLRHLARNRSNLALLELIDSNTRANYLWWSEDHNQLIELQAAIPLRLVGIAIAERARLLRRDDAMYLFWQENLDLLAGDLSSREAQMLVDERRDYYEGWRDMRGMMPKAVGAEQADELGVPGLNGNHGLAGTGTGHGQIEGPARIVFDLADLRALRPKEIIVCEAMPAAWSGWIQHAAGCVAELPGLVSHTAIIARELNIPCVIGVAGATHRIKTGDRVSVDGVTGEVWFIPSVDR